MFRHITNPQIGIDDWLALNASEVPTEAIDELYRYRSESEREEERELRRLDNLCLKCNGGGEIFEGEDSSTHTCEACDGTGVEPDSELYGEPFAWGTCWVIDASNMTPAIQQALIDSGFVLYQAEGGPYHESFIFGVDGAGYSFRGQHWIPLRLRLAHIMTTEEYVDWPSFDKLARTLREWAVREGDERRFLELLEKLGGPFAVTETQL